MLKYLDDIIYLADSLDRQGFISEANLLDGIIKKIALGDCYPEGHESGKKWGRDIMAKIFCCIANDSKWPEDLIKEVYFPYLPNKKDVEIDPDKIEVSKDEYTDITSFVAREKKKYPGGWKKKRVEINKDLIHPDSLEFISEKKSAKGYKKRLELQKKRIAKEGTENITKDEPIMLEKVGNKYKVLEGWHRILAILEMIESGELKNPKVIAGIGYPK